MGLSNAHLLLIVNFLHFLAAGLVVPVFAKQILRHGGNHIILGSVQSVAFVAQFISKDVLGLIEREKLYIIKLSVYCCFLYFTLLIFIFSWWGVSIIRISFALTSQILPYSKELISRVEPRKQKIQVRNLLDIMRVTGLSAGSIAGGYIFQATKNFISLAVVASVISFLSVIIMHLIDYNEADIMTSESQIFSYRKTCNAQLMNLRDTKIKDEWYDVALKLTYTCAFVFYFAHFTFLLCYNYPVNSIIIGWTRAYYNIILFFSNFIVPFVKDRTKEKLDFLEKTLIICAFCLVGHSYAPTYRCYMVLYVPLLFTYTLSNALLDDDALDLKFNIRVYQSSETMQTIIKIGAPFVVGVCKHLSGGGVTKILTIVPAVIYGCMLTCRFLNNKPRRRSCEEEESEEEISVKEDEEEQILKIDDPNFTDDEDKDESEESQDRQARKVTLGSAFRDT